ncbi:hypothetical protein ID856_01945 [Xenorhabdus sp. 18]|nr:hypothetical protein [Xenorhabdus sp. 18]MBD2795300.1 hypothetical protein [Xenorhabdus sp. 18]
MSIEKDKNSTRVFVAHRPETISVADRIYNLKDKAFTEFEVVSIAC